MAGVPPRSLEALQALGSLRTLEDGQILQIHGDENTPAVLVLSGTLMFGLTDTQGRCHVVRPVAAGQFFNVLPVFDRGPAIHDAYASGKTKPMLFEAQAFLQLVQKHHELRDALHQMLHYRNRLLWNSPTSPCCRCVSAAHSCSCKSCFTQTPRRAKAKLRKSRCHKPRFQTCWALLAKSSTGSYAVLLTKVCWI